MSVIVKQDSNGVKPLLQVGELGYDNYAAGGDIGRVFVGTGTENIGLAKKTEVMVVDGKANTHIARVDNPHGVTKAQVGLGNADNTADVNKNVLSATRLTTARTIELSGDVAGSVSFDGTTNVLVNTAIQPNSVALGTDTTGNYVDSVIAGEGITVTGVVGEGWTPSIAIAPVGTSGTYTKVTTNDKGQVVSGELLTANDIPNLDASKITSGIIDAARLPASAGNIPEYATLSEFPIVGDSGKVYIALDTNKMYRWSGSTYVSIAGGVDSVAGKTGVVSLDKGDVGLVNVDNTSDINKPISIATQTALDLKANAANAALTGVPTAPTASVGTNTTQLATTAFVNAAITDSAPTKTGTGASGTWGINITGNSASTTKLATARTINGVAFDGTANITIADSTKAPLTGGGASGTWGISITGNASTANNAALAANATKLATERFINGVSFDGTSNITIADSTKAPLNGTGATGTWGINITGNSASTTKLATARTINGVSFDGTGNITIADSTKAPLASPALTGTPTAPTAAVGTNTTQLATTAFVNAEIANDAPTKTGSGASGTWGISVSGNAATATKLATARTINGVAFDGTGNITIADSTKAPLASPALTGTPTAPTAAVGTNTTQIATTAFVLANTPTINTSSVAAATAGISAGGVGSYVFAVYIDSTSTVAYGATVAGSKLYPTGVRSGTLVNSIAYSSGTALSGTWRCMGYAHYESSDNMARNTLWLRIA